jgi:TonB-linked SusC/RagA family outer membrane protein
MQVKKLIWILPFLFSSLFAMAQMRTISGKVSEAKSKEAIIGANVFVKGTTRGTITDTDGNFTIDVNSNEVLLVSYIGSRDKSVNVGNTSIFNITLESVGALIEEVVVTAFGVTKEKRSLSHASQTVTNIDETPRENFLTSLGPLVAGATVNASSGAPGASSQIVLRGFNSLSGNNSPLFIVDGLPISNSVFDQNNLASQGSNRGDDFTNRIADLNPNDIASITILKGPEAAALYGIDAGSGAIIITTKKGKKGAPKITYDNQFRVDQYTRFQEVQTEFDLGVQGNPDSRTMNAFGPRLPAGTPIFDNTRAFFQDALVSRHNLTVDGGVKGMTYRGAFGSTNQKGTIPNTGFDRYNVRGTLGYTAPNNKFDVTGTAAYTNTSNQKAFRGAGGFLQALLLWPVTDDATKFAKEDGSRRRFYDDTGFPELDNPFWQVNNDKGEDKTNRFNYNASMNFRPTSWLTITGRGSVDKFETNGTNFFHPEGNAFFTVGGQMEQYKENYLGLSGVLMANVTKTFGKMEHGLRVGTAVDDFETKTFAERGQRLRKNADGLFAPEFSLIDSATYTNSRTLGRDTLRIRRLVGTFAEYTFNYNRLLYLNIAGRRDMTSTLPSQSRNFFYPSAGASFIFSELLAPDSESFFGKLRFSVAETAKDISPYGSQSVYNIQQTSGGGVSYGFTNNNQDIVPERQRTFEVGTEMSFFKNRLSVDYTYYNTNNVGQIVRLVRLSYGTGFILSTLNVADTRNRGMELVFRVKPIVSNNFNWDITLNASGTRNLVKNLPANIPEYYNSDSWVSSFRNGLIPGGTTTTITGNDYRRNDAGQILIDPASGIPLLSDPAYVKIGDRNPSWNGGLINNLRYKNLSFSAVTDLRWGGDIVNGTEMFMVQRGVSTRTLDREKLITVQGVLNDGLQNTANPTVNNIQIDPYFSNYYADGRLYANNFVERNIKWFRLREITLRYKLPEYKNIKNMSVFVTGTDLAIFTNYSGADPAVNANSSATTGIGSFGMDFFGASTPRGFAVGLRADIGK